MSDGQGTVDMRAVCEGDASENKPQRSIGESGQPNKSVRS